MGNSSSRYGYEPRYPAGYMPSYPALPPWKYEKRGSKWNPLRMFSRRPTYEDAITYYHAAPMPWQLPPGAQYPGALNGIPPGQVPIPGPAPTSYMPVIPRSRRHRRRHQYRSSSPSSSYSDDSVDTYDSYARYLRSIRRHNPVPPPPKDILATTPYRNLLPELPSSRSSRSHRRTDHNRSHSDSYARRRRDRSREDEREREERRRHRLDRKYRSERERDRERDRDREHDRAYGRHGKHHRSFSETAAAFLGHMRPGYGMPEPHLAPPGADPPPFGPEAPPPGPPPGSDVPPMHVLGGGGNQHQHQQQPPVIPNGATMQMPTPGMGMNMPTSGTGAAMPGIGGMHMPTPQGGANAMPVPGGGPATMRMPTPNNGHGPGMPMPMPMMSTPSGHGQGHMPMPTPGRGGGLAMPMPGHPAGMPMSMPSPGMRPGATPHPHLFAGAGGGIPGSAHGMPSHLMPSPSMPMPPPLAMGMGMGMGMPPSGPPLRFTGYGTYNVLLHTSDHKVLYEGELYPTAMHLFEAMKFMHNRPDIADEIRCTPSPYDALEVSKRHDDRVRPDWDQVALSIMDEAMYHKFRQHEDARTVLLATGNAPLEFGDTDDGFWGIGRDERGRNEMGQSLVRVRDKLRQELGMM